MAIIRMILFFLMISGFQQGYAQCDYTEIPNCQDSIVGVSVFAWTENIDEKVVVKTKVYLQKQTTYYFRSCLPAHVGPLWIVLLDADKHLAATNQLNEEEFSNQLTWFVKESGWFEVGMKLEYGAGCCTLFMSKNQ